MAAIRKNGPKYGNELWESVIWQTSIALVPEFRVVELFSVAGFQLSIDILAHTRASLRLGVLHRWRPRLAFLPFIE